MKTHRIEVEWGENIVIDDVADILEKNKNIKAVLMTQCETSTGILNPVEELSKTIQEKSDSLINLHGRSYLGGVEAQLDAWGLDVFVTGSQKTAMLPAGLTFVAVSDKAWQTIEKNKDPRSYLDVLKYRDNLDKNSTPYTPALSLIFGLEQALNLLKEEGLENVYARHTLMKDMTRAAMKALGVPLLTDDSVASPTVTAVKPDA